MRDRLRDWWRGYSDIDLASARIKVRIMYMWSQPGAIISGAIIDMTHAEMTALRKTAAIYRW